MNNDRLTELTNKYIDNEITAGEEKELNELLKDQDNKSYFDAMIKTIKEIENCKPDEQNVNVKNSVMNRVNNKHKKSFMNKVNKWFEQNFTGPKISYAVSFALGAFVVGLIFLMQPSETGVNDLFTRGIMSSRNFDDTYFLNERSLDGEIKVRHSGDIVVLDVNLVTSEVMDCELTYNETQFGFYGVKSLTSNSGSKFVTGGGKIKLSDLSSNHYMVFLKNPNGSPGKIYASFYNNNTTISKLTIDIKK